MYPQWLRKVTCWLPASSYLRLTTCEKEKPGSAALFIVIGIFIKLFAGLAALLFLFYHKKTRFLLYLCLWTTLFLFAPLLITSPGILMSQYKSWIILLSEDRAISTGMSIYTILTTLFGFVNKTYVLIGGFIVLLLPLLKLRCYSEYGFRLWFLSLILIWIVIFNHKGESPTYVIALAGCAIWGAATRPSLPLKIILIFTWFFSSFIKSDVFPQSVKQALRLDFTNAGHAISGFFHHQYFTSWGGLVNFSTKNFR